MGSGTPAPGRPYRTLLSLQNAPFALSDAQQALIEQSQPCYTLAL